MKKTGKKKKKHRRHRTQTPRQHPSHTSTRAGRKKGIPGWTKGLLAIIMFGIIGAVAFWQFSPSESPPQPLTQPTYPSQTTGVFYNNPTVADNNTRVQIPFSYVEDKKIVFLDLGISERTTNIVYKSRDIPLSSYRNGNYLPVIVLYTPSGSIKAGIRTCEPCAGFSMHIGEWNKRSVLVCDVCNTRWDIETFRGLSGGCPDHPPPLLPVNVGESIDIDLSTLDITLA